MARRAPLVPPTAATGARVGRTRPGSAKRPTRAQRDARAELLRAADRVFDQSPELVGRHLADGWTFRYLESSRGLGPPPASLSPADQAKINYAQADSVVHVITAVLDGLGVSDEVWEQGADIAKRELKAASPEGWEPL
jgi:hypothetical protein